MKIRTDGFPIMEEMITQDCIRNPQVRVSFTDGSSMRLRGRSFLEDADATSTAIGVSSCNAYNLDEIVSLLEAK